MTINDKNMKFMTLKINKSKFKLNFRSSTHNKLRPLVIHIKAINVANNIHSKYMQENLHN